MSWPADGGMAHRALLYTAEPDFRAAVGAFIREGLDRREPILAAIPAGQLAWLRAELGSDVPAVEFADAASFYRRQGQATRAMLDWLRRYARDGQRVRIVAEQAVSRRTPARSRTTCGWRRRPMSCTGRSRSRFSARTTRRCSRATCARGWSKPIRNCSRATAWCPAPHSPTRASSSGISPLW